MQDYGFDSVRLGGTAAQAPCHRSLGKMDGGQARNARSEPTLWKSQLAALKRRQEAQAQSIRMLVHELRSPVATSKSMVATLRYLNPQDTPLDSFLVRIERRMDQLLDLVNDILELSQARLGIPWGRLPSWIWSPRPGLPGSCIWRMPLQKGWQ